MNSISTSTIISGGIASLDVNAVGLAATAGGVCDFNILMNTDTTTLTNAVTGQVADSNTMVQWEAIAASGNTASCTIGEADVNTVYAQDASGGSASSLAMWIESALGGDTGSDAAQGTSTQDPASSQNASTLLAAIQNLVEDLSSGFLAGTTTANTGQLNVAA